MFFGLRRLKGALGCDGVAYGSRCSAASLHTWQLDTWAGIALFALYSMGHSRRVC